ncbi:MAG: C45 family autoproteolytic acyltransferase/hydrolase [Actinomycetota bacterium]
MTAWRGETAGGLPVVRVRGGPEERGRAVGEALAPAIHRSLAVTGGWMGRRGVVPEALPGLLGPYREAAAAAYPDLVRELDGLAAGAAAPWWELFAANAFEELEELVARRAAVAAGPPERCTAFAAAAGGGMLLGHDEQWFAADSPNCAVIVAVPDDGPAFASPTAAAFLPAVGLNAAGTAQAIMSLTARDDGAGIPRVFVSRAALQSTRPEHAVDRATPNGRAGGYAHLFVFADGAALTVETSARRHAVLPGPGGHTNHYLDPALAAGADPPGDGTTGRLAAVDEELSTRELRTPEDVRSVLSSHRGDPDHVCRHPRPGEGEEADAVIFAMACDPGRLRLWVAGGLPCRRGFAEVDLTGEFAA